MKLKVGNVPKILLATALVITVVLRADQLTTPHSCTNISLSRDGQVLFANNEDTHFRDLVISFSPASLKGYGIVQVGFRHSDGTTEFGGVMNDQGLAWDLNTAPNVPLNPHPERPYSHEKDNYLAMISRQAATVEEAIRLAQKFDFGDSMAYQFHIADASGDAVIISAGPDGELAFTRKDNGDGYLLLTNFNPAYHKKSEVGWRYQTALSLLEDPEAPIESVFDYAGSILDAVHLNTLTSYTLYSNVFDLKNKEIYLYYMSQYDEVAVLNLADELARGERVQDMRDFFSPATVEAGDAAYRRFETRFTAAKLAVIVAGLGLVGGGIGLAVRKIKKRKRAEGSDPPNFGMVIKIF